MKLLLRLLLVALVLEDLAFVQITGAASPTWLWPLVALTVASPLLFPLRRFLLWRLAWNAAILAVFALLVEHATSAGVQYLLEDGLLLAALCQVHLLNNIGADQKPDLIFFNSFLVPLVTSFLSLDSDYCVTFLLYVPVLLVALELNALNRPGRSVPARIVRRAVVAGLCRSGVVLGLTLVAFFFLPRDFSRRGLLGKHLAFRPGVLLETRFSEDVELGRTGKKLPDSDRIVFKVAVPEGDAPFVPACWRGATLTCFDGKRWLPPPAGFPSSKPRFALKGRREFVRPVEGHGVIVRVDLEDPSARRLFLPLVAEKVRFPARWTTRGLRAGWDQTFSWRPSAVPREAVSADVEVPSSPPRLGGAVGASAGKLPPAYSTLSAGVAPRGAKSLAKRLRAAAGDGAPQARVVERMRAWLAGHLRWLPPGDEGEAADLADFLSGRGGGHCEYFATALAVLLREEGIPCRLVTGYRSEDWDAAGRTLTFRRKHAHAWVEVNDPRAGWYTVDPSPPAAEDGDVGGSGILGAIEAALTRAWGAVTGMTEKGRRQALAWLAALPARSIAAGRHHPGPLAAIAFLMGGLLLARSWRRRRAEPPAVREYRRALRMAGVEPRPGETPRDLLERARSSSVRPDRLAVLTAATARHEAARYATRSLPHRSPLPR